MKNIDLIIEEDTIQKIEKFKNGKKYILNNNTFYTINYSNLESYLSNELGTDNYKIGKTIKLIKDQNNKLLAIKENNNSILFIEDEYLENNNIIEAHFYSNINYIKNNYNLTKEDLLMLIKSELSYKRLILK